MSRDHNFFGSAFDTPADDPLLVDEVPDRSGREASQTSPDDQESTGWTPTANDDDSTKEEHPSARSTNAPAQKTVVVDREGDSRGGIEELNRALGAGWRLVRLSLPSRNGSSAPRRHERVLAVLEQERPRSLFDFG